MIAHRSPRQRNSVYMGWVAQLPCIACMVHGEYNRRVQVAHLRMGNPDYGKRSTGMAEKPSDHWVTPLCMPHHTGDDRVTKHSQHKMSEEVFWTKIGIDPFQLCVALFDAFKAGRAGSAVIARFAADGRRAMEEGRTS